MSHSSKQATIAPFRRPGSWEFEGGLREQATFALGLAERAQDDLRKQWTRLRERHGVDDAARLATHEKHVEVTLLATAAAVLSAMTAEAFLNFYGVKRLGQKFYQSHYERLGLVQKLSSVVATCCGVLLDDKAEIVSVVRELSEARNRLVHPKTKEVNPNAILAAQPATKHALTVARESVANIGRFYEMFASLDPDSRDIVQAI